MLHILLTILKILGILLLALIGILLVIVLSALFVPVCYRAHGRKTADELSGKVSVSWLFRLIYARVVYEGQKTALEIFLFGIPILAAKRRIDAWKTERRKKKAERPKEKSELPELKQLEPEPKQLEAETEQLEPEPKQLEAEPEQLESEPKQLEPESESTDIQKNIGTALKQLRGKIGSTWNKVKGFFAAIRQLPGKIADRIRKIRLTFLGICDKIKKWYTFLQMEDTREAIRFLKEKGKGLLRHILPRKVRGKVVFGFDDPALTGQVLAGAAMIYPLYQDRLQLTPVFDHSILEGEIKLSGRIFGGYLLWQAWQIYRNREVKVTYRRFQHKEA